MKKFLSLVLAAMMLLSCTAAFAADTVEAIDVRETDDRYTTGSDATEMDDAKTELWLQVDANGQIDVTVPLVLVFQTNIDGGEVTSPATYKITNHGTSDLVVTKIDTDIVADNNTTQPMNMVAYTTDPAEDEYRAQLTAGNGVIIGTGATNGWDLIKDHENDKLKGGLFEVLKAKANGTAVDTAIAVTMKTGPLSFITSRLEGDKDTGIDDKKGVKLMTVTYTMAIDTSDAIGETITTSDVSEDLSVKEGEEAKNLNYTLYVDGTRVPNKDGE